MCVCVCAKERGRERETERVCVCVSERAIESACVCVCVCVNECEWVASRCGLGVVIEKCTPSFTLNPKPSPPKETLNVGRAAGPNPQPSNSNPALATLNLKLPKRSHGSRPVHQIITTIKWIRTIRLPIKNALYVQKKKHTVPGSTARSWRPTTA